MPATLSTKLKAAERRSIVLQLKESGATYEQIATIMHQRYPGKVAASYDKSKVFTDIKACLTQLRQEMTLVTDNVRTLELARLERLMMPYYTKALTGDHKSLESVLKIQARAAAYRGLDKAPKRDDVLTMDTLLPLLETVNRAWNDACLALLTPEMQDQLFSMVQQRLEALAAAAPGMAALLSGGSSEAEGSGAPADTSAPEAS
jgi:hypothetical protein